MSVGLKDPPVPKTPGQIAKVTQVRFIDVLKTDHGFDIVKEIIDEIGMLKRSKKIKPQEKRRLLNSYYLTLLSYCVPKQKIIEDNSGHDGGKGVVFKINIGVPEPQGTPHGKVMKSAKGVTLTIPTQQNTDGSYEIKDD